MKSLRKQTVVAIALFLFLMAGVNLNLLAQPNPISSVTKNKLALDNLKSGINSENDGVRKSSIYFAGKYKIAEVVNCLVERLENEQEPSVRLLIAYSLYEIKDSYGMEAVKDLSRNENDLKVKRVSFNIYKEFLNNNNSTLAL